jgi:hypothetical protein
MRISMDMHRPAEAVVGFLLIGLAFVVDLGAGAMVISVLLGAVVIALAFGGFREGDEIPPATHMSIDRLVAAGIAVAALVALLAAHVPGAVILALLALAMGALVVATRYVSWSDRDHGSARG